MTYRYDIDGLRAIAVLAVVLFHIDPSWVPGGFIGVDIFFVISGFLITTIIQRQMQTGKFSFREFYRRRVLRILPAATLVIATTLIVGQFVMLPDDLNELAKSAAAAQLWSANIYFTFFLDTGYFADAAILQPLLHLWSLGVEEQFYLFWPVALLFGMRWQKQNLFWLLIIATMIASFVFGQLIAIDHPEFAYYMLPSRAGQLLAGALIATAIARGLQPAPLAANASSILGLILIGWSLFALSGDMIYPGINAVSPTLGAALMLYGGAGRGNLVSVPLALFPVRYIGLISYSLYLWHWPVLSFYWYAFGDPDLPAKLATFAVMLLLSIASYYLVENPFRHLRLNASAAFFRIAAIPAICIVAMTGTFLMTGGYGVYALSPQYKEKMQEFAIGGGPAYSADYVCQGLPITEEMITNPSCAINGKSPNIILWGDSNAAHYVGALKQAAEVSGGSFRNIAHASCPPIFNKPDRYVDEKRKVACRDSVALAEKHLKNYHTIIISASWDTYVTVGLDLDQDLSTTIKALRDGGHTVLVMGRVPRLSRFDRLCQEKSIKLAMLDCSSRSKASREDVTKINDRIKNVAVGSNADYFDLNDIVCDAITCFGYLGNSNLYYDASHWSVDGSTAIGKEMISSGKAPAPLMRVLTQTTALQSLQR